MPDLMLRTDREHRLSARVSSSEMLLEKSGGYLPVSESTVSKTTVSKTTVSETTEISEQVNALDSSTATPNEQEVAEVIAQLEEYKARLIEDFTATAKKAKLPKSITMSQLENHPEILKIDASLAQLRGEESGNST